MTRTVQRSSSVRTVTNPRRRRTRPAWLLAKQGSTTLYFDGRNFSAKGKRKFFGSMAAAYSKGERLLKRFPILKRYRLYAMPVP